jgi:uncharacterized membrane protein YedE/YeeE
MTLPFAGGAALAAAVVFGFVFGWLLHRGRVADFNTIVGQLRLRDFTVMKVMFTAIIVGGLGVYFLTGEGLAKFHIKDANLLSVALGAAIFGVGMAIYGYCPGTGLAAAGSGRLDAIAGIAGMLLGALLYAASDSWMQAHVVSVVQWGKARLPDVTGAPDLVWFGLLIAVAGGLFVWLESRGRKA